LVTDRAGSRAQRAISASTIRFGNNKEAKGGAPSIKSCSMPAEGPFRLAARWNPNRRHEWASSLITLFRDNGYHLEFFSFPERLNANHFDLIALPLTLNATSPESMDHLIFETLQAPLLSDPVESSMSVRSYQSDDGRKIGIRFALPAVGGVGGDNVGY
jgi:hypothetical protein